MSKIGKISTAMLGTTKTPRLKAKAAESRHLFPLMRDFVVQYGHLFGQRRADLLKAVDGLLNFYAVCRREPRSMSVEGLRDLQKACLQCVNHWKRYRGKLVFKFHMMFHLGERAAHIGCPSACWTYPDEELNRRMGNLAKVVHKGRRFYTSFLQRTLVEVC